LATMPQWASGTLNSVTTLHASDVSVGALLDSLAGVEDRLPTPPSNDSIATIIRKISQAQLYLQLGKREVNSPHEILDHQKTKDRRSEQDDLFGWIDVLLRLLTIHQSIIRHIGFPQETLYQLLMSLSLLATTSSLKANPVLLNTVIDAIAFFSDCLSSESQSHCIAVLRDQQLLHESPLQFLFTSADDETGWLQITEPCTTSSSLVENLNCVPFPFRKWEMVQDATPTIGENDTCLSLTFFGAKKAVV